MQPSPFELYFIYKWNIGDHISGMRGIKASIFDEKFRKFGHEYFVTETFYSLHVIETSLVTAN
jgi:hypothetical protein